MVNELKAIRKAGEWANLSGEQLEKYLISTQDILEKKLEKTDEKLDSPKKYFSFLNREIFPQHTILNQLKKFNVSEDKINLFQNGEIPIEDLFKHNQTNYDLDEIVDFIMFLKFIHSYLEKSEKTYIYPRNRLQYLLYLVNFYLSKEPDPFALEKGRNETSLLSRTGYRYTFRKTEIGPISNELYRDKDRLFAWNIIEEQVSIKDSTKTNEPYSIKFGEIGELLLTRFKTKLQNFDSLLLREWESKQRDVIEEFVDMSQNDLYNYVCSIQNYQKRKEGRILLNGRSWNFGEEIETKEIPEVIKNV